MVSPITRHAIFRLRTTVRFSADEDHPRRDSVVAECARDVEIRHFGGALPARLLAPARRGVQLYVLRQLPSKRKSSTMAAGRGRRRRAWRVLCCVASRAWAPRPERGVDDVVVPAHVRGVVVGTLEHH
jgi:hypothetical protein